MPMENFDDLFLKRMNSFESVGAKYLNDNNALMDKTFTNHKFYQRSKLYNQEGKFLQDIDIRFQRHASYSIVLGNQTDYWIQFRPNFFPEICFPYKTQELRENVNNRWEHYGFYVDVKNSNGTIDKYLIIGKEDRDEFVRYNALKCNWYVQWKDENGKFHRVLGVLRNKQVSDNTKSSGYVPTIQGGSFIYLPYNDETATITYNTRFILSINPQNPKAYEVTNIYDTFPMGVLQISVSQVLSNSKDDTATGIADNSAHEHDSSSTTSQNGYTATLICDVPKIRYKGASTDISYIVKYNDKEIKATPKWTYFIEMTDSSGVTIPQQVSEEDLNEYFDIEYNDNTVTISYPRNRESNLVGYTVDIMISDGTKYSTTIQLKVVR